MASLPTRMADKQATLDAINRRNAAAPTLARPLYSHVVTSRVYHKKKRKRKKKKENPQIGKTFVLLDYKEVQSLFFGKRLTMKNRLKVESPILICLVPNKRTTGASELQECNDMHEETTSDNSSGEVGTTLALLAGTSPKLSDRLREISNSLLKWFPNSETPAHIGTPKRVSFSSCTVEAKTPNASSCLGLGDSVIADMPQESLVTRTTDMKKSLQKVCLTYINSADK